MNTVLTDLTLLDLFLMAGGGLVVWTLCELAKYAVLLWWDKRQSKKWGSAP